MGSRSTASACCRLVMARTAPRLSVAMAPAHWDMKMTVTIRSCGLGCRASRAAWKAASSLPITARMKRSMRSRLPANPARMRANATRASAPSRSLKSNPRSQYGTSECG